MIKNKYQVLIEGANLLMVMNDLRFGFFTTRYVKTGNHESAAKEAISLIKDELFGGKVIKNDVADPPIFTISEIKEIGWLPYLLKAPGKGFSFFPENEADYERAISTDPE